LVQNTEAGFYKWLQDSTISFSNARNYELFIISHKLTDDDFILVFSTKSL